MIEATKQHRKRVVQVLSESFDDNKSVNYIIKQDGKRKRRIRKLMEYSFDACHSFGKVFISEDGNACALVLLPDKKRTTLRSVWRDARLILHCIGIGTILKVMRREAKINASQPNGSVCYLWFIGVHPAMQGKGAGIQLLQQILNREEFSGRRFCLETSTVKNLPWYQKFGFNIYEQQDFGYTLYFLIRE